MINWTRQPKLPNHLLGNHVSYVPHLLSPEQSEGLRRIALDEIRSFDNIAKDNKFYKSGARCVARASAPVSFALAPAIVWHFDETASVAYAALFVAPCSKSRLHCRARAHRRGVADWR